ncbi:MAG: HAMP domain-containing histidine kinase [Lachnospiraceae bacterium]|nr:HAMP domain-containing histidine kinase [Lachnospiraceae bacterium]
MKSVPKLIRRFVGIMLLSSILLIFLNFVLLAVYTLSQASNGHPWTTAQEVADNLLQDDNGYVLSEDTTLALQKTDVWALFIDNETMKVVWQTDNLPETIPMSYSVSDIAGLTRGYIDGYPTFTGEAPNGLVVLGYPKESFWKHMWPSWDYNLIANLPKTILSVLAINVALVFVIYVIANSKLLKSIKPIVNGIQALPTKEVVYVREKGLLSELAASINQTSKILQSQSRQLRKKETARANWIAGVSHDIRTPLSMVMGYAGQLEGDERLPEDDRQKAMVIIKQSNRMRNLVNDLNLASKLEYNMQPVNLKKENMVAVVRQVVVDFMNVDIDEKHPIEWKTDEALTVCPVNIDKELIKRAVSNLIQNSIEHNEQGCNIYVDIMIRDGKCTVTVADDGVGATDEQIERLNNSPHYMVCDENTSGQRHGLGLLIVRQIAAAHGGAANIEHSEYGGFSVKLILPLQE